METVSATSAIRHHVPESKKKKKSKIQLQCIGMYDLTLRVHSDEVIFKSYNLN